MLCAPRAPRALTLAHTRRYDGTEGRLDKFQLKRLMGELGQPLDDAEAAVAMTFLDEDGNGVIDFNEFVAWWAGTRRIKAPVAKPAAAAAVPE